MSRKRTKTQRKKLVKDMLGKAQSLYIQDFPVIMSMKDYDAIRNICDRIMKRIDK